VLSLTLGSVRYSTPSPSSLEPTWEDQGVERRASAITIIGLTLALMAAFALWFWTRAEEASAIRALPESQRTNLFDSTRRALVAVCDPVQRPPAFDAYCSSQAGLILQFDQCDDACRELARRAGQQPRR
jgi:hypothetical protein